MRGFGQATILIPSFHGRRSEHLGPQLPLCVLNTKEKKMACSLRVLLLT